MKKLAIKKGDRYEKMVVVKEVEPAPPDVRGQRQRRALCRCDCGEYKKVLVQNLRSGMTKSCGCLAKENVTHGEDHPAYKHGDSQSPLYVEWVSLRSFAEAHGMTLHESIVEYTGFKEQFKKKPKRKRLQVARKTGTIRAEDLEWVSDTIHKSKYLYYIDGVKYYTLQDAANRFKVSRQAIEQWFKKNKEGCVKVSLEMPQ